MDAAHSFAQAGIAEVFTKGGKTQNPLANPENCGDSAIGLAVASSAGGLLAHLRLHCSASREAREQEVHLSGTASTVATASSSLAILAAQMLTAADLQPRAESTRREKQNSSCHTNIKEERERHEKKKKQRAAFSKPPPPPPRKTPCITMASGRPHACGCPASRQWGLTPGWTAPWARAAQRGCPCSPC